MHELDGNSNNGRLQCCACAAESTQFIESPLAQRAFVAPLPHLVFYPQYDSQSAFSCFFFFFCCLVMDWQLVWNANCSIFSPFSVSVLRRVSMTPSSGETGPDTDTLGFRNDPLGPRWLCFTLLWPCKMWITIFTDHLCFCLSGASRKDQPSFTLKQVSYLCERLLKDHEEKIREEYEQILNTKLAGNQK